MRAPHQGGPRGARHLSDSYFAGVGAAAAVLAAIGLLTSSTGLLAGFDAWPGASNDAAVESRQLPGDGGDAHAAGNAGARSGAAAHVVRLAPSTTPAPAGAGGVGHRKGHGGKSGTKRAAELTGSVVQPAPVSPAPPEPGSKGKGHGKGTDHGSASAEPAVSSATDTEHPDPPGQAHGHGKPASQPSTSVHGKAKAKGHYK